MLSGLTVGIDADLTDWTAMKTNFVQVRRKAFWPAVSAILYLTFAHAAWAGITDAVKYAKLSNGLQVIVLENHKAPVATFNVFYQVGSRNESLRQDRPLASTRAL